VAERAEAQGLVERAGRCVPVVPSRAEHREAHPRRPDPAERVPHERGPDARPLAPRVDRHHVDLTRARRVLLHVAHRDETERAAGPDRDPHLVLG
jgi:hypothetical protein